MGKCHGIMLFCHLTKCLSAVLNSYLCFYDLRKNVNALFGGPRLQKNDPKFFLSRQFCSLDVLTIGLSLKKKLGLAPIELIFLSEKTVAVLYL